jgi:hypothetical protein
LPFLFSLFFCFLPFLSFWGFRNVEIRGMSISYKQFILFQP